MKKFSFMLLMLFILSGCVEPNPDLIKINLKPGIDTIEVGSTYEDPGASAKYGVMVLEVTVIENNVDTSIVGTYEIIYEATHNTFIKTVKRIVTVIDQTPPNIVINPGIDTIYTDEIWIDEGVTVSDHSQQEITVVVIGTVGNQPGIYEIMYQATDVYGNQSTALRLVHVIHRP
jgi:hypothetical protein